MQSLSNDSLCKRGGSALLELVDAECWYGRCTHCDKGMRVLGRFGVFLDASIGRRLGFGMGTMLIAVLAVSTVFVVRAERREMEEILREKGKTALNITSPRIGRALNPHDSQAIADELRPVLEDRDFDYAYVFDATRVLAKVSDPGTAEGPPAPLPDLMALLAGKPTVRNVGDSMEILTPIVVDGKRVAGLGLGVSLDLLAQQGGRIRLRLVLVTAGLVTCALAFIYWWTRKTVAPLLLLTRSAQRFSEGDLHVRVPVTSVDEVGTLASTFNHLAESLERTLQEKDRALAEANRLYRNLKVARARLGQAERLSAVGMLAAGVSHELNNPLGIILSTAGNLREALGERSPWREDVTIIEGETQRCRRIIQGLLNFAASGETHPAEVDLNALLRDTFALAVRDDRARALTAEWVLDPHLPLLHMDPHQMQQVFLNLLLNAGDAMAGRGIVTVRTAESIEGGRRSVLIEFADQGCGIEAADLDRIFDPFYTTKKGGTGFGLGLAVSYGIISAHGGEIRVASERGRGSVFAITLPVRAESTLAETA
jgi:two-component system NtrC family sensor kinase